MNTPLKARSIRNTLLAIAAVSTLGLPLIASASTSNIAISYDKTELESTQGQERIYTKLQVASRKLCGSSDRQISGSLSQSIEVEKCYSGTLTAAVQRLDNDAVTSLHSQ